MWQLLRDGFAFLAAFVVGAAAPLVPLMLVPRAEIPPDEGQWLTRSEVLILAYLVSVAVGAVVGIPSFLILRSAVRSFWRRILLTGAVLGVVVATLLWFGTTGGRSVVLWALPLGVLSAVVFGAVWQLLSRRSAVAAAEVRS